VDELYLPGGTIPDSCHWQVSVVGVRGPARLGFSSIYSWLQIMAM
jgi:hypothetical protein